MNNEKNKSPDKEKKPLTKPDEETLHTTDPQEHMEGPISSLVQKVKEKAEENDNTVEKETDRDNGHTE